VLAYRHGLIVVEIQQQAWADAVIALKQFMACEMPLRDEPLCFRVIVIVDCILPPVDAVFLLLFRLYPDVYQIYHIVEHGFIVDINHQPASAAGKGRSLI